MLKTMKKNALSLWTLLSFSKWVERSDSRVCAHVRCLIHMFGGM